MPHSILEMRAPLGLFPSLSHLFSVMAFSVRFIEAYNSNAFIGWSSFFSSYAYLNLIEFLHWFAIRVSRADWVSEVHLRQLVTEERSERIREITSNRLLISEWFGGPWTCSCKHNWRKMQHYPFPILYLWYLVIWWDCQVWANRRIPSRYGALAVLQWGQLQHAKT